MGGGLAVCSGGSDGSAGGLWGGMVREAKDFGGRWEKVEDAGDGRGEAAVGGESAGVVGGFDEPGDEVAVVCGVEFGKFFGGFVEFEELVTGDV